MKSYSLFQTQKSRTEVKIFLNLLGKIVKRIKEETGELTGVLLTNNKNVCNSAALRTTWLKGSRDDSSCFQVMKQSLSLFNHCFPLV